MKVLNGSRDKLNILAEQLLEKEVIFKEDMETIFGKRTFDRDIEREQEEKDTDERIIKEAEERKVKNAKADAEKENGTTNGKTVNKPTVSGNEMAEKPSENGKDSKNVENNSATSENAAATEKKV